jgi:hypothetical protein
MPTVDFSRAHPQFRIFGTLTCEVATLGELIIHLEHRLQLSIQRSAGDRHFIVLPKGDAGRSPVSPIPTFTSLEMGTSCVLGTTIPFRSRPETE